MAEILSLRFWSIFWGAVSLLSTLSLVVLFAAATPVGIIVRREIGEALIRILNRKGCVKRRY